MKRTPRNKGLALLMAATWFIAWNTTEAPLLAQIRATEIQLYEAAMGAEIGEITIEVGEAAQDEPESASEKAESSEEDKAREKREKERLDAIKKWVFDRRPSAVLKLWSKPPEEDSDADEKADEEPKPVNETTPSKAVETEKKPNPGDDTKSAEELEKEAKEKAEKEKLEKERQEREKAEKKLFEQSKKLLTESVTKGDWELFSQTLADRKRLSGKEAVAVYDRMLDQLASGVSLDFKGVVGLSDDMQKFMQQMMSNRRNNPATAFAEKHVIDVPDLVGILIAAPEEIRVGYKDPKKESDKAAEESDKADSEDDGSNDRALQPEQLDKLSKLVRHCFDSGNPLDEFTGAMKNISAEQLPRENVAVLLSKAGNDVATVDFLPTPDEAKKEKNAAALNLLAKHYLALHRKDKKESLRVQAWQCTLDVLELDDPKNEKPRAEALTRAVSIAPKLDDDLGERWLRESFTKQPDRGQLILAKLGTATAQRLAQMPQDGNMRGENLVLQHAAVDAFLETGTEIDEQWSGILNLLAANWLQEAGVTRSHSGSTRYGSSMRRDRYGNLYYATEDEGTENQAQQMVLRRINPVKVETILDTAPSGTWFDTIDAGLQPKYTALICRLWLKVNESEKAFPFIETLSKTHPDTARELAEEFLRVWTKDHNPNQESSRTNYYMFMYGYDQKADKIPLTRSKQERNLKELSEWIGRLRKLPLDEDLDESLLVDAFMTCHSIAEVYGVEDIEKVFGNWADVEAGTMAGLINKMRRNLAGVWRDPNVQRDSKTKRKKQDIQAEVTRGYSVAQKVLDDALAQHPDDWQLLVSKGCIMHDENDFIQSVQPSSEFSSRRKAAFDVFSQAAESYVKAAPELPEREQSLSAFDHWFYAALGASDLAGISQDNRPDVKQIARIKSVMSQLSGDLGERHQEQFANALFTRMSAVSPACKFRYLDAGFQLVDPEDPKAVEAKKVYDYYNDLVTELQLVTRVDGDHQVGHENPFGLYVDLRHTKELERESGGFAKYLQNQKSGYYYSFNYGRPTENYRDKFQDAATTALEEQFEILSVTFNHPETKSRDAGDGWRITPYAYLLLKARGPEVDKIPSLKIDLDFLDTSGYVVLPIDSSPLPIDASETTEATSLASKVDMFQLLDERQADEGKLIVETRVTARGLVPELDSLVDTQVDGFKLAKSEDSDVSVIEFDKEASEPVVLSERTWTLEYEAADPAAPAPDSFAFPTPVADLEKVTYQRYVDADLEEVESSISLVQDYGSNRRAWVSTAVLSIAGLVLVLGLILALRSKKPAVELTEESSSEELTPFGLLTQLRQVQQTGTVPETRQAQLHQDIDAIETHYFAETNGKAAPDLATIAGRWS